MEVYNEVPEEYAGEQPDGVVYEHWKRYRAPADVFVAWRYPVSAAVGHASRGVYVWLQDVLGDFASFPSSGVIGGVFVVSRFHAGIVGAGTRAIVAPNALDPASFVRGVNDPLRLVFASAPNRGLVEVLRAWPRIRASLPMATLHVYYGFTSSFVKWAAKAFPRYAEWEADVRHRLQQVRRRVVTRPRLFV